MPWSMVIKIDHEHDTLDFASWSMVKNFDHLFMGMTPGRRPTGQKVDAH